MDTSKRTKELPMTVPDVSLTVNKTPKAAQPITRLANERKPVAVMNCVNNTAGFRAMM